MIKRSFSVLRFLNRRHVLPIRVLAAFAGGVIALLSTGRIGLAQELFSQFFAGSFKLGGRRCGFYLRTGWPRREIAHDPFFNFTEDMSKAQLETLASWLKSRQNAMPVIEYAGNMMLLEAARAHSALENEDQADFDQRLAAFKEFADGLLESAEQVVPNQEHKISEIKEVAGFEIKAAEVLRAFEQDLPIADWNWFVIGGTFLGLVRDSGFLPHDVDLDVGLFLDDLNVDDLCEAFEQSDTFSVAKFDHQTEIYRDAQGAARLKRMPSMLKIVHSNGVNLDVFLHERRDGKIWHGSGVNKWVNEPITLKEYTLDGQKVLGPEDADTYLREHYGEWRQVVKDFSCITGTTNLAFVKNLHTIAVLFKRYAHFSATRPLEAKKVMFELLQQGYVVTESGRTRFSIKDI